MCTLILIDISPVVNDASIFSCVYLLFLCPPVEVSFQTVCPFVFYLGYWFSYYWILKVTNIILLGTYPREVKTYVHTKTCTWLFIAALICNSQKTRNNPNCSSSEWINTLWYIHTTKWKKNIGTHKLMDKFYEWKKKTSLCYRIQCIENSRKYKLIYTDREQISGCLKKEGQRGHTTKGHVTRTLLEWQIW